MTGDDFSELMNLAAGLKAAPGAARKNIKTALKGTSMGVKKAWKAGADRTGLAGYAASIDFEITEGADEVKSEIGPNLGRNQGSFGFVEDATGDVRSAPQHAGRDALEANQADFERGLQKAIADAVEG